jgi:hypothetical protein
MQSLLYQLGSIHLHCFQPTQLLCSLLFPKSHKLPSKPVAGGSGWRFRQACSDDRARGELEWCALLPQAGGSGAFPCGLRCPVLALQKSWHSVYLPLRGRLVKLHVTGVFQYLGWLGQGVVYRCCSGPPFFCWALAMRGSCKSLGGAITENTKQSHICLLLLSTSV